MAGLKSKVSADIFHAMQNVDIGVLSRSRENELRPVLPCLVRMALCKSLDESSQWAKSRKEVSKILNGIEVVNSIVALLSIDFHVLEEDVKKEQQLRQKMGGNQTESILICQLESGLAIEFERSDPARRIRLLLSELLFVMSQVQEQRQEFYFKQSDLFDSVVYLEEVADVLCIAQAELPNLLSLTEVAETALHVPNGDWLLCCLLANAPDNFYEVCKSLVSKGEKQDEESVGGRRRLDLLLSLCKMNPKEAYNIRALCVHYCTMPGLAVFLTLQMSNRTGNSSEEEEQESTTNTMAFISGLLLGNDIPVRHWFSLYVKAGQKRKKDDNSSLQALRLWLLSKLKAILPEPGEAMSESSVLLANAFIRLYCALKGMATLRFTDEEMKSLLSLVTSHPPFSSGGARFVSLSLCMLIACPYLLGNAEQERQAKEWISWIRVQEKNFKSEGATFGEMLFLIAIHFHNNATTAIADLVCNTLGMKSVVKANALARMRQIFTQEIFTEQVITTHAVKVPVTEKLNATRTGYLPINSVYQLLKSRSFSKHKVPIKDWIHRQICVCTCPIHPLMPSLIEVYVNSIIVKSTKTDHLNEPMSNEEVLAIFSMPIFGSKKGQDDEEVNIAPHLLMLYYLLLYSDTVLTNMKVLVSSEREVKTYPDTLMAQIPINYLLQKAQDQQHLYAGLFSPLLRLMATQYPQLCDVEDWLLDILEKGSHSADIPFIASATCTVDTLKSAFSDIQNSTRIIVQLKCLLQKPEHELLPFANVILEALPMVMEDGVARNVQNLLKRLWGRLHSIMPRMIRLGTVNALDLKKKNTTAPLLYTENDVTVDPLVVLRCDKKVFRCPPILEIVLRVLNAYMQACRVYLTNHMQANPVLDNASQIEQERRDLKNALIAAQDSAIVQILLECCQKLPEDQDIPGLLNNQREAQCIICSFIHQMFIAEPNLAKLVHFQGYPDELLPLTVSNIPSIHICLDFIPELLTQPQIDKQIFAIKLVSHLCCRYALPKSLSMAKLVTNVMFTLLSVLESSERVDFLLNTVPCLVRICQAFPPLCEDASTLLTQIGRLCVSHLSADSNMVCGENMNPFDSDNSDSEPPAKKQLIARPKVTKTGKYEELYWAVQSVFRDIVKRTVVTRGIYS